jgi:hypothetical protein
MIIATSQVKKNVFPAGVISIHMRNEKIPSIAA